VQVNADPKAKCLSYINLLIVDMGESEPVYSGTRYFTERL